MAQLIMCYYTLSLLLLVSLMLFNDLLNIVFWIINFELPYCIKLCVGEWVNIQMRFHSKTFN
jgi:hypothetical protein